MSRGTTSSPATSTTARKMLSLPSVSPMSPTLRLPVIAMPDSSAIMAMPRMSSMIRIPNTSCAKRSFIRPMSPSTLMITVVDDIESMAPRKIRSIVPQSKNPPIS